MTSASKSIYYFGIYLALTAITLMVSPNTLLAMLQVEPTTEVWIRIIGVVVLGVSIFYVFMAPSNNILFMTLTVYVRTSVLLWFILFIALGLAPIQLLLFGLVDAAGAAWTFIALRGK